MLSITPHPAFEHGPNPGRRPVRRHDGSLARRYIKAWRRCHRFEQRTQAAWLRGDLAEMYRLHARRNAVPIPAPCLDLRELQDLLLAEGVLVRDE